MFKLLAETSCKLAWKNWKQRNWQFDGDYAQNALQGRFQTGIVLLGTLILALTDLF